MDGGEWWVLERMGGELEPAMGAMAMGGLGPKVPNREMWGIWKKLSGLCRVRRVR